MKEASFAQHARASIWQFKDQCSTQEFESLKQEVKDFCNSNKELPVSEQKRLFEDKYGHLKNDFGSELTIKELRSINSKLLFFVIITIISIIIGIIAAIGGVLSV